MRGRWILFGLLLCGLVSGGAVREARAAALHKCVGADGVASYQSVPCSEGQRTDWVRAVTAAPPAQAPAPAARAITAKARAVRVATRAPPARRDAARERCAAARREAEHVRDRLWNRLSFRQRSELDAKVARACAAR